MKRIILDCGAHLGESVIKFRNMYPNDDCHFYMFEPNTYLYNQIESNKLFNDCYKFNKAVSNMNGLVKLYGCIENKLSVGSTLEKSKADFDNIKEHDFIEIESIDISDFISQNFSHDDYIVLKLDIEGSEYDVLERLIETKIISYVNELYCEFHKQWLSSDFAVREDKILENLAEINLSANYWDAL